MRQVKMKLIIDILGLIDFYKDDNNSAWGTDINKPCKADSFCSFIASNSSFTSSSGSIHIWERDCTFTWEIFTLNDEPLYLYINGEENLIIMEMVQIVKGKEHPDKLDWEKIFFLNEKVKVDPDSGKLIITEKDTEQEAYIFEITTINSIQANHNLTYSIEFTFHDGSTKRYGVIDPFIKIRSDDEPEP